MTLAPGIHSGIPAETYHTDPAAVPSLSASIANILIGQSPAHARAAHPKLNPGLERDDDSKFELGTAAHDLFLQGVDLIAAYTGRDWRTNDAKAFRDQARAQGKIPMLADQAARCRAMVDAIQTQLDQHTAQPRLFAAGAPEQTLIWEDDHGVVCRARLDWLRSDYQAVDDLKSSAVGNPYAWTRKTMWSIGAPLQARLYQRGVKKLTGIEPTFRFCLVETQPPYALSVVDLAPDAAALADAQIDWALRTWAGCLESGVWPGYPRQVLSAQAPAWLEAQWLEREGMAA